MNIEEELQIYDYIFSIDLGTTFSGSCFSYIQDRKSIVHVVRWPEQLENDTYEKTPTACLYDKRSHNLIAWGKSALDYMTANPEDDTVIFIDQFKLKLQQIFQQERNAVESIMSESEAALYRNAAIDYLREIRNYTCDQLIKTVSVDAAVENKIRYILTIPATWIDQDCLAMKLIAIEAGLITENDPDDKLMIINEAYAAALFCEREYCVSENIEKSKLIKGQRYLLCDAGGGTVDLATYECTGSDNIFSKNEHCQLALESGGTCGSTILDQNMENYLRDQIFIGCIEESVLKGLVDQFIKEIKHYFGGDSKRNNYVSPSINKKPSTGNNQLDTTLTTAKNTKMNDIQENDYNYKEDYPDYNSDEEVDEKEEEEEEEEEDEDDDIYNNSNEEDYDFISSGEESDDDIICIGNGIDEKLLSFTYYVYFTLPIGGKGIDPSILENLCLKESIVPANNNRLQLRISHENISKYVFDPVVKNVVSLIEQQIKKSHTKINTLFLLGGFGQSPYLYKKLHSEFITNTNSIAHIIVPDNGYRASMRGGIYLGIDCVDTKSMFNSSDREITSFNKKYTTLVGIDLNFFDLTAVYSFVDLSIPRLKETLLYNTINAKDFQSADGMFERFWFDSERFASEYYSRISETLNEYLKFIQQRDNTETPIDTSSFDNKLFYEYFVKSFIHQLYESIEKSAIQILGESNWNNTTIRYYFSTASYSLNSEQIHIQNQHSSLYLTRPEGYESGFSIEEEPLLNFYIINLVNSKALSQKNEDTKLLNKTISEAATEVGMVTNEDAKERIISYGFIFNSHLVYYYFFSPTSAVNNKEIYTFDFLNGNENECRVISCIDKEAMLFSFIRYPLLFKHVYTLKSIEKTEIEIDQCTFENFISYLSKRTNFMGSHVRDYIKNHVDLSIPTKIHIFRNIFFIPGTNKMIDIEFGSLNETDVEKIHKVIQSFESKLLTTESILTLIIIPWIQVSLASAIMNMCRNHQTISCGSKKYTFLFNGEIIKTNTNKLAKCPLNQLNSTWEEYLFTVLRNSLQNYKEYFLSRSKCYVIYDAEPDYSRHVNCLINGAIHHGQYLTVRKTNKRYALHVFAFDLKSTEYQQSFWYKIGKVYHNFSENESKNGSIKALEINALKNNGFTFLHPLIDKGQTILPTDEENTLKIQVTQTCSFAAVLYVSEDQGYQEYSISNSSFKKLHRFIFPIQDPEKSISLSYTCEKQSLLFTLKHDNYEADFRCPEFHPY